MSTFVFIMINLVELATQFVTKSGQQDSYAQVRVESIEMPDFNLKEQKFYFYVSTRYDIPKTIGSWKVLNRKTENFRNMEPEVLEASPAQCTPDELKAY